MIFILCFQKILNSPFPIFLFPDLLEAKILPTIESILQKRDNPDCFFLFCDNFLSRIVGISIWREGCQKKKISEMATASDETFAYLLVENYWEYWSNLDLKAYKSEVTDDKKSNKRIKRTSTWGKYTKSAYGARMYGGWMTSRLLRFNELYEEVQADRLKNGEMVEDNYLQHCIDNKISAKKVAKTKNCDVIAICEDLTEYL